ncbi:hypothetical protein X801_05485 [Opisthorchis viverrini]|uniref:Uncharacterized protein n=1 Tax=Opisthorchis viverrini TaxID=6198 RepID=A0A1S8WW30_OPIVI|nr:hypothetical protein X801_05485 [Opisthorchis viverrini]
MGVFAFLVVADFLGFLGASATTGLGLTGFLVALGFFGAAGLLVLAALRLSNYVFFGHLVAPGCTFALANDANEDAFPDEMNVATTDVRDKLIDINFVVGGDKLLDGRK